MKYWNYFKTICRHKYYVFIECCKEGIIWQGIVHDLSKFSPQEFFASARYYNGDGNNYEYQLAWIHHKNHNKHHWEYWIDRNYKNGKFKVVKIPEKYMKEMYADIVGASRAYNKDEFDKKEPYKYFIENSRYWIMTNDDKIWLMKKLMKLGGIENRDEWNEVRENLNNYFNNSDIYPSDIEQMINKVSEI